MTFESTLAEEPIAATPAAAAEPTTEPNKLARICAAAIVSWVAAAIITKLLGRKAGFIAFFVSASTHEVLDEPLAQLLAERFDVMRS